MRSTPEIGRGSPGAAGRGTGEPWAGSVSSRDKPPARERGRGCGMPSPFTTSRACGLGPGDRRAPGRGGVRTGGRPRTRCGPYSTPSRQWASEADHFTPMRVEADIEVHVPDPDHPDQHLATEDGAAVRYRDRVRPALGGRRRPALDRRPPASSPGLRRATCSRWTPGRRRRAGRGRRWGSAPPSSAPSTPRSASIRRGFAARSSSARRRTSNGRRPGSGERCAPCSILVSPSMPRRTGRTARSAAFGDPALPWNAVRMSARSERRLPGPPRRRDRRGQARWGQLGAREGARRHPGSTSSDRAARGPTPRAWRLSAWAEGGDRSLADADAAVVRRITCARAHRSPRRPAPWPRSPTAVRSGTHRR